MQYFISSIHEVLLVGCPEHVLLLAKVLPTTICSEILLAMERKSHWIAGCASRMVLVLLVLSGDIKLNPGPPGNSTVFTLHLCLLTQSPPGSEYKLKGFRVIHLNAHSLYYHLDELVACVMSRMPKVVGVSETWLNESILSAHLAIPG